MPQPSQIIPSLDEALTPGAESLLTTAMQQGLLNGVAIGILRGGQFFLRFAGKNVAADSRFQLGSVTKVYTAELLAILAKRGTVRLDDPITKFLPTRLNHHDEPRPITLLDLATHRSGLPRLPPIVPLLAANPYATYTATDLERYLAKTSLQLPEPQNFLYSNLGYSVLGYALAQAAGMTFAELLDKEILQPLGLDRTSLAMEGAPQAKLLRGHTQAGFPTKTWTFDACAPCGALCSTTEDQLKWLAWLLTDSDRESLQPQASIPGGEVGLGWMIRPGGVSCWHNGATAGSSSWVSLNREQRTGVVILSNRQAVGLVNTLGTKFEQHLSGQPAQPLKGDYGRTKARLLDPIRIIVQPLSPALSPLAALPALIRIPLVLGIAYAILKFADLLPHR
jgi:CubicO group peptidase (beta-lactamase class C family)